MGSLEGKDDATGSSNPRTTAYVYFKMPVESSTLPGAGLVSPDLDSEHCPGGGHSEG